MSEIGVRELKLHASEILQRVREKNESFQITHRGRVVARLVPAPTRTVRDAEGNIWMDMDDLAEEIAANWPPGLTAPDAVAEQRR
jgi:prevent-host-death family protein